VHIIINNQIGFTTEPRQARTSYHCTDAAKMIEAPVFHVNGDDVDAVVSVCKLAVDFRQKFNRDVVVDIVCYRRHGHTNKEDPKITQPLTYKLIDLHPQTIDLYSKKLIDEEVMTAEEIKAMSDSIIKEYTDEYEKSKEYVADPIEWLASNWQGLAISSMDERPYNHTGVRLKSLKSVGNRACLIHVSADVVAGGRESVHCARPHRGASRCQDYPGCTKENVRNR
jgi:2-oxoglutarate dehydrogenase E1 component